MTSLAVTDTRHQHTLSQNCLHSLPSPSSWLCLACPCLAAGAEPGWSSRAGFFHGARQGAEGMARQRWVQSLPHHMVGMGSKANPWDVRVLQEGWEAPMLPQVPSCLPEKGLKAPRVVFLAAPGKLALGRTCEFTPGCSFCYKELVFGVV